jgi:hypothetical protein
MNVQRMPDSFTNHGLRNLAMAAIMPTMHMHMPEIIWTKASPGIGSTLPVLHPCYGAFIWDMPTYSFLCPGLSPPTFTTSCFSKSIPNLHIGKDVHSMLVPALQCWDDILLLDQFYPFLHFYWRSIVGIRIEFSACSLIQLASLAT